MGIDIAVVKVLDNLAEVKECYCKVRDMTCSKMYNDKIAIFTINYSAIIEKDSKQIELKRYRTEQQHTPFADIWACCYSHLKENLTKEGIQHTDNI